MLAHSRPKTAKSMHANGVYFCFCDGSVHWISDFIEVSHNPDYFSVWDRLILSADGLPLSGNND